MLEIESTVATGAATLTALQDAPDGALLQRYFVRGDGAAMDCFFARHTDGAYRVALSIVGNRADAEDVVQTAFLNVLTHIKNGRDGSCNSATPNLRGWLMSIVVRAGLSCLRGDDARRRREEAARGQDVSAQAATDLEKAEVTAAALGIVRTLPMHYRLPLSLHLIEGLSIQETAGALTAPEPTVRKQLARGLALVREALAAAGFACSAIALPEVIGGAARVGAPQSLRAAVKALGGGEGRSRTGGTAGTARTGGALRRLRVRTRCAS